MDVEFPRIIRKTEAARCVGYSVRHIERLEALGKFPKRIKLGDRASGYLESQVREFITSRIAASQANSSPKSATASAAV